MQTEIEVAAKWWADNLFTGDVSEIYPDLHGLKPITSEQVESFRLALVHLLMVRSYNWPWDLNRPLDGSIRRTTSTTLIKTPFSPGVSKDLLTAGYRAMIPGIYYRLPPKKQVWVDPGRVFVQTFNVRKQEVLYEIPKKKRTRAKKKNLE